jgi:hypothetical protein
LVDANGFLEGREPGWKNPLRKIGAEISIDPKRRLGKKLLGLGAEERGGRPA